MKYVTQFTLLGWILAILMFMFFACIVVPGAKAEEPKPRARLILEIKDEKLRVFEYETTRILCHFAILDVSMIGSQGTLTCVKKDVKTYRPRSFIEVPLAPAD